MVNFQFFVCFIVIFGLVPTKAFQEDTEVEKTCTFEEKSFRTAREIKDKTKDLNSCQDVCDAEENCLIWRDDGISCNLTVYTFKDNSDVISSGINNCQNVSDNAISCEAKKKDARLSKKTFGKKQDQKACKTLCEESVEKCILWEEKKNKCTHFNLVEQPSSAIDSTYGARYCSTPVILPEECMSYNNLTDATRSTLWKGDVNPNLDVWYYCDEVGLRDTSPEWKGDAWYRMTGDAGTKIPDQSPGKTDHCGTYYPGWLSGTHPTSTAQSVDVEMCFSDDCEDYTQGRITNCGSYFVYYLVDTWGCAFRYCATN